MKIRQKLVLGFLGTSILVGGTGSIATLANLKVKYAIDQLNKSSIKEAEGSSEMLDSLQAVQGATQEILAERYRQIVNPPSAEDAAEEIELMAAKIETELENFKQHLEFSRTSTQKSIEIAEETTATELDLEERVEEENEELAVLNEIAHFFESYEQITSEYVTLVRQHPDQAERLLENALESTFRDYLFPLIQEYNEDAKEELIEQAQFIDSAIAKANRTILLSSLLTVLVALLLGSSISYSIANPIARLKTNALQVSQGQLDVRSDITSQDEIGILARTFNDMMDSLSQSTVSVAYLDNILQSMLDALLVVDLEGKIVRLNQAAATLWGYEAEELFGQPLSLLFEAPLERGCLLGQEIIGLSEKICRHRSGKRFPVSFLGSVMQDEQGKLQGIVCIVRNITEQKQAQLALQESEERYALAAAGANDGLWDWNLVTEEIYFSPRWKAMLGLYEQAVGNRIQDWLDRVPAQDLPNLQAAISAHLEGKTHTLEIEYRIHHSDGSDRWILCRGMAVRDDNGRPYRIAGSQTDITDRRLAAEQLSRQALYDSLTNLPNRTLLMERMQRSLERMQQHPESQFAILFVDLDRFKVINDSLGHLLGDKLLLELARRLQSCTRPGDTVARLGGDEFTILAENLHTQQDAILIAERIQAVLKSPFTLDGHEVYTSSSVGIALSNVGYRKIEDLLRDADTAMYQAKAAGKAQYAVFDPAMHSQVAGVLRLETDLRRALERQEFQLYYQPIVSLKTGRLKSFEALIRWRHPQRGLISPAEFIPVAEETGLIVPIGEWVLEEACRQMRLWQQQFPACSSVSVSVNMSAVQFTQPNLVAKIDQILKEIGLAPQCLKLEITESVLMKNEHSANATLIALKNRQIQLAIDDFGTGYSSLSYLHRLPIDTVKIDRCFVNRLEIDSKSAEVLQSIITLAHALDIKITAEGVENREQVHQLQLLGCDLAQGYLLAKPLNSESVKVFLNNLATETAFEWIGERG